MSKAIAVVSGGLDSTVMAHYLVSLGQEVAAVASFDYGQRHRRELDCARALAGRLGAEWLLVDLAPLGRLLPSALTTDQPVPEGHYADESMRATVVPNRNAIMLNIAAGIAAGRGAEVVGLGVHAGDHPIYPDCRPGFVDALNAMLAEALEGYAQVKVLAPFVLFDKANIVRLGAKLGVDFAATWSCYQGGALHCGRCGTCVERREAFALAGVADPTRYEGTVV